MDEVVTMEHLLVFYVEIAGRGGVVSPRVYRRGCKRGLLSLFWNYAPLCCVSCKDATCTLGSLVWLCLESINAA